MIRDSRLFAWKEAPQPRRRLKDRHAGELDSILKIIPENAQDFGSGNFTSFSVKGTESHHHILGGKPLRENVVSIRRPYARLDPCGSDRRHIISPTYIADPDRKSQMLRKRCRATVILREGGPNPRPT